MAKNLTEDEVRDIARNILGFKDKADVKSGVGQLTTFNQLGFWVYQTSRMDGICRTIMQIQPLCLKPRQARLVSARHRLMRF